MWYLWNPVTSKIIHLPPLILRDEDADFIGQCCLSSPPDDPSSILLLTRTTRPTFVYCRLNRKLRWTEMLYASQLKKITGYDGLLHCPTFYDGKVYALKTGPGVDLVIQLNIVVKDKEVLIKLLLFGRCPFSSYNRCPQLVSFLKGSRTGLFYISVAFNELTKETLGNVFLYKLVMSRMRWEEMKEEDLRKFETIDLMWEEMVDLKDAIFFVDLARESVFYSHAIASELGGYIHIRCEDGKMLYSYDVEDETISVSSMPYPTSHVSLWECWLGGDNGEAKCTLDSEPEKDKEAKIVAPDDEVELIESRLFNIPFHILEMVMELCVGVEYMYFRATCKRCHLAAPLIQWSDKATLRRLHQYSVVAPWLMVVDNKRGILSFTDPIFGDKYFMKNLRLPVGYGKTYYSRFGWLLFHTSVSQNLVFFNPFTSDLRKLPTAECYFNTLYFSAPPTSPDCRVIGFSSTEPCVYHHFVGREETWRIIRLDLGGPDPSPFCSPIFYGADVYAMSNKGELCVFNNFIREGRDYSWKKVVAATSFGQYYLMKCDQHLLLVIVGKFGEFVEVFKLNHYKEQWEKIECLGRHMIYLCGTTSLCMEAKTPEMRNKIYFPRLHSKKNGKIVFYSLETRRYHRFDGNGKNIQENWFGSEHVYSHVWIEPSWS